MPRQVRIDISDDAEKQFGAMKNELNQLDTPNIIRMAISELHKRLFPNRVEDPFDQEPPKGLTIY